jgi:hypothetical protein
LDISVVLDLYPLVGVRRYDPTIPLLIYRTASQPEIEHYPLG